MADNNIDTPRLAELRANRQLPSPRGVALEVLRLAQQDDIGYADIVRVIQADPALSGKLIRAANCAGTGARRPIVSLHDAVLLLGLPVVRQLALGFSLVSGYRQGPCKEFDYTQFWKRSLLLGLAAQAVAGQLRMAAPEELFACGLMAQIGALALATAYPVEYGALLGRCSAEPGADLRALEQQALVTDHVEVSVAMLLEWGLPRVFVSAVAAYENPDAADFPEGSRLFTLAHGLSLAECIVGSCLADGRERRALLPALLRKSARVGLDGEAPVRISEQLSAHWHEWAPLLELPAHSIEPLRSGAEPAAVTHAVETRSANDGAGGGFPLRVLVVESDASTGEALRRILTGEGHAVAVARSGREGVETALRSGPQVIICPWGAAPVDSLAMCRALRETAIGRGIYMLLLTGSEDEERLIEAFDAGFDDHVRKPVNPRVLAARLRSAQRLLKMRDERDRDVEDMRSLATELALNNRRLQQAALTDSLTGLPNRRCALDRLDQEWAAARRRGSALSCIVIDVDHFKSINDRFGHDAGDRLLCHIANVLRESARLPDAVCRVGGEEFLVVCPDTSLAEAYRAAERLRAAVSAHPLYIDGSVLQSTISLGVATMDTGTACAADLVKKADQAVYKAKGGGRNATFLWRAA